MTDRRGRREGTGSAVDNNFIQTISIQAPCSSFVAAKWPITMFSVVKQVRDSKNALGLYKLLRAMNHREVTSWGLVSVLHQVPFRFHRQRLCSRDCNSSWALKKGREGNSIELAIRVYCYLPLLRVVRTLLWQRNCFRRVETLERVEASIQLSRINIRRSRMN